MSHRLVLVGILLVCLSWSTLVSSALPSAGARHARSRVPLPPSVSMNAHADLTSSGSVFYDGSSYKFVANVNDSSSVAQGRFINTGNITGWGELWIQTTNSYPDAVQMYAAGYLEGVLTATRIYEQVEILHGLFPNLDPAVRNFLNNQTEWTRQQIKSASPSDENWQGMALIMQQFDGLVEGYNVHAADYDLPSVSAYDFNLLHLEGDIDDIRSAVHVSSRAQWDQMNRDECRSLIDEMQMNSHCSVLIKVTGDLSNIYASHSTWAGFAVMNRIFKHYDLNVNAAFVAAHRTSFSSYPGMITSYDDFWYMDTGLVMVETNIDIYNMSLYDATTPYALMGWQRIRLACQNAWTGEQWSTYIGWQNSGTYNNEYLILDYKLFTPGHSLKPNTLWLMDLLPGIMVASDVSAILSFGYVASYNVPYHEYIYNVTGYPQMRDLLSSYDDANDDDRITGLDYQAAHRAQIMRRDQGTVTDLTTFQHLMRYNDYEHDPISQGDPANAICSRYDLRNGSLASAFGCIDSKVISYDLYTEGKAYIINGPTTNNGTLPPFSWAKFPSVVHAGEPDVFAYDWVPTQWQ